MKLLLCSGIVGLSLCLPACSAGDDTPPELSPPPALDAAPELSWRACGQFEHRSIECAELEVPIDYAQPNGEHLPIALRRVLANPLEPRRGALLFNPGGPGGAGIDTTLGLFQGGVFDEIAPGFDIIGFEPRGVKESGERGCGSYAADTYPDANKAGPSDGPEPYLSALRELGDQCEKEWGPLFRKLGSNNVVRDLEEIRRALRQPVLNFYAASYGTRLGALYAHQYPETTGRIVLDAPVQPRADFVELIRAQFRQVVAFHEQLFRSCETAELPCPAKPRQVFEQALSNARARGLEEAFVSKWRASFDSAAGVLGLVDALAQEAADPGGDWLLSFLSPTGGSGLSLVAYASVSCTDDAVPSPTVDQLKRLDAEFTLASPLFAGDVEEAALCSAWPATRDPVPLPTASLGRPLLVIGGTKDMRTPYAFAQAMTDTLGNATLLTSEHFGHGAALNAGPCVRQAIRAYLTLGSLPASGASCP